MPICNSTVPAFPAFSRTLNLLNQFPQRVYPEDTHINHNNHDNYNALGTGNHATHITITRNVDSIIGDVNGDYCDCLTVPPSTPKSEDRWDESRCASGHTRYCEGAKFLRKSSITPKMYGSLAKNYYFCKDKSQWNRELISQEHFKEKLAKSFANFLARLINW